MNKLTVLAFLLATSSTPLSNITEEASDNSPTDNRREVIPLDRPALPRGKLFSQTSFSAVSVSSDVAGRGAQADEHVSRRFCPVTVQGQDAQGTAPGSVQALPSLQPRTSIIATFTAVSESHGHTCLRGTCPPAPQGTTWETAAPS